MKRKLTPEERQKRRDQEPVFDAATGAIVSGDPSSNVIVFPRGREVSQPQLVDDDEI